MNVLEQSTLKEFMIRKVSASTKEYEVEITKDLSETPEERPRQQVLKSYPTEIVRGLYIPLFNH